MEAKPTQLSDRRLELEKSVFKNSSILINEIVSNVENARENGDAEVLVTNLKEHIKQAW